MNPLKPSFLLFCSRCFVCCSDAVVHLQADKNMFGAVLAPRGTCCVFHFQCDFVPVLLRLHTMTPHTLVESPLLMTLFQCQCDHCCDNGVVCPQLSCWRAHPAGISSVRCAEVGGEEGQEQDLLLVASQDCTVSLWSLQGGLVGVLGKHTWSLSNSATWQDAKVCKHAVHAVYTPACLLHLLCRLPVICVCLRGSLHVSDLRSWCAHFRFSKQQHIALQLRQITQYSCIISSKIMCMRAVHYWCLLQL